MNLEQIKSLLHSEQYDFLRANPNLGNHIILLGIGGSHAYGTNTDESDLDIRGCALDTKEQLLLRQNFEQVINNKTDTTIYSLSKIISLLSNCNPNVIEMLGLKPEHYLYMSPVGKELLENRKMFLSKKALHSFGGYAGQQLYRLKQITKHEMDHGELEQHILKTLQYMQEDFVGRYTDLGDDYMKLYIDSSSQENYETEIFMDIHLTHYPLRDYLGMWNELQATVRQYNKVGKRNKQALEHNKIGKHMMHLLRLYMMCIDILEKEEIITYRENEHELLMEIRNGKYITENNQVKDDFYKLLSFYENRLKVAADNTKLPEAPDYKAIQKFLMETNEKIVTGEL